MCSTFPTLFPYGKADFDIPRSRTVTLAAYAKHMLKYQDGRFGRHPLFCYYVFNRIMREQALDATRFLCGRLDKNGLSLDEPRLVNKRQKLTVMKLYITTFCPTSL